MLRKQINTVQIFLYGFDKLAFRYQIFYRPLVCTVFMLWDVVCRGVSVVKRTLYAVTYLVSSALFQKPCRRLAVYADRTATCAKKRYRPALWTINKIYSYVLSTANIIQFLYVRHLSLFTSLSALCFLSEHDHFCILLDLVKHFVRHSKRAVE